jgi:hypothetical protein
MAHFDFVDQVEFSFKHWQWPFADGRRSDIQAYFRRQQEQNPALWNGQVLLLHAPSLHRRILKAQFFETDYASMVAALE